MGQSALAVVRPAEMEKPPGISEHEDSPDHSTQARPNAVPSGTGASANGRTYANSF